MPASLLGVLSSRRPALVVARLVVLSVVIELLQGLLGLGNPDLSDVIANSLGAVLGAAVGAVVLLAAGVRSRALGVLPVLVLAAAAAGVGVVPRLAAHHQEQAVERFGADTLADLRRRDREGSIGQRVFAFGSTYSDGRADGPQVSTVRYPTSYLGVRQCVVTTWTPDGVRVRPADGETCRAFLG